MRWATTLRGVQVSGPSSTRVHRSGRSSRRADNTAGVRSSIGIASSRTNSMFLSVIVRPPGNDTLGSVYQLLFPGLEMFHLQELECPHDCLFLSSQSPSSLLACPRSR